MYDLSPQTREAYLRVNSMLFGEYDSSRFRWPPNVIISGSTAGSAPGVIIRVVGMFWIMKSYPNWFESRLTLFANDAASFGVKDNFLSLSNGFLKS